MKSNFPSSVITLFLLSLHLSCASKSSPPNILILFTDDQRFDTIRALGNNEIHTPNMDRLAAMGTAFTRAHVMVGYSGAVCAPSRAMLMTGRHALGIVRSGGYIPEEHKMMPEHFAEQGYATFATGKWHQSRHDFARAFSNGDNIYFGGMHWPKDGGHERPWLHHFDENGEYPNEARFQADKFSSETYADAAIDFIERQKDGDEPFFAYVSFTSPHDPRTAPQEFRKLYDPAKISLPPNFMPEHPFNNGDLRLRDEKLLPWPRTPEMIKKEIAEYYAMISEVDAQIGRILDALEASGQLENTIIVFAGDNGLAVGQHGLLGKQNLYEHSVRIPMIMAGPGVPAGEKREQFAYLFDLFPTLCEMSETSIPETVQGKSLAPILRQENAFLRENAFFLYYDFQRGVRTHDNWKLIKYFVNGVETTQLFDLNVDPSETKNLADDPAAAGRLTQLREILRHEMKIRGDELDIGLENWGKPAPRGPKVSHNAVGKSVKLSIANSPKYPALGARSLIDGRLGQKDDFRQHWLGFEGDDLEALIDLGEVVEIKNISVSFLQNIPAWIFSPAEVAFDVSENGESFQNVAHFQAEASKEERMVQEVVKEGIAKRARFVRIRAKNTGECPAWHPGAGGKAWLFVDEIQIK